MTSSSQRIQKADRQGGALRHNKRYLRAHRCLGGSVLGSALFVPFLEQNGLRGFTTMVALAIPCLVGVIIDVPLGMFADCYGRKRSMLIGSSLTFISFGGLGLSHGFVSVMFGLSVLMLGQCFISGPNSALARVLMEEDAYKRFEAQCRNLELIGGLAAALLGSVIAWAQGIRAVMWWQMVIEATLIWVASRLKEPAAEHATLSWRQMCEKMHNKTAEVRQVLSQRQARWLVMYFAALVSLLELLILLRPFYCKVVGVKPELYGELAAIEVVVGLLGVRLFMEKLSRHVGSPRMFVWLAGISVAGCIVPAVAPHAWLLIMFAGPAAVFGASIPLMNVCLSRAVSDEVRASYLSAGPAAVRLCFVVVAPLIGWTIDEWSLSAVMLTCGSCYGLALTGTLLGMKKA